MSDTSGAWYHCANCGCLFKAAVDPEQRGRCPECGEPPGGDEEVSAAADPVKIRRKTRKKQPSRPSRREGRGRARMLMIFVVAWVVMLGAGARHLSRKWRAPTPPADLVPVLSAEEIEDRRILRDHLEACGKRLGEFLTASDTGARGVHVLGGSATVQRMARVQQFNPSYATDEEFKIEEYGVIHTPAGRAIESLWKLGDDKRIEVVFLEEDGEWKIDWDAYARVGSESWALFLAGRGSGKGEFRLFARERIGAERLDDEFIGLVLYSTRFGYPGEAVSPSPEIKVERDSPMGRQIEDAFLARKNGVRTFGSKLKDVDPDEMIRLRVRVSRKGEDERVFQIDELLATHWFGLAAEEPSGP